MSRRRRRQVDHSTENDDNNNDNQDHTSNDNLATTQTPTPTTCSIDNDQTTMANTNLLVLPSDAIIKGIFLLLGVGILIPWNAFVSAKPYFQARLCQQTTAGGGVYHDLVDSELWFGVAWNVSSVISLGLIIAATACQDEGICKTCWNYCCGTRQQQQQQQLVSTNDDDDDINDNINDGPRILSLDAENATTITTPENALFSSTAEEGLNNNNDNDDGYSRESNHSSHNKDHSFWLVMVPLGLYLTVFSLTDLLVLVVPPPTTDDDASNSVVYAPRSFLMVTLIGLVICGTCGAIATAGIVSTAGLFPSHLAINPFFSGQALGGVAVAVANFFAATLENPQSFWDAQCSSTSNTTTTTLTDMYNNDKFVDDGSPPEQEGVPIITSRPSWTMRHLLVHQEEQQDQSTCTPYTEIDWAVFAYFLAGCLVLAGCLAGYSYIHKFQETGRHHQQQQQRDQYEPVQDANITTTTTTDTTLAESSPRVGLEMNDRHPPRGRRQNETTTTDSYHDEYIPQQGTSSATTDPLATENTKIYTTTTTTQPQHQEIDTVDVEEYTEEETEGAVFTAIKGPAICIYLNLAVTLCLFPSWVSQLRSVHECQSQSHYWARMNNDLYVPFSFVVFNVGDLVGRLLAEKVPVERIRYMSAKLVISALGRFLFFPLFLLCLSEHSNNETRWTAIPSDLYSLLVQFGFAVTNGILMSTSFMHAPHLVAHTAGMQERASEIMTFAVYAGLLSGSLLSFPFSEFATPP